MNIWEIVSLIQKAKIWKQIMIIQDWKKDMMSCNKDIWLFWKRMIYWNNQLKKKNENCFWLAKENAELKKKLEETETILESKHQEVNILMNKNADMKKIFTEECEKMRKENVDLNKKIEEQYHTIQQYEQWFANWSYHWEE